MSLLAQLINGISLGSIYALIALGYTMVYGIAKMLNFAHGDIIMVGSFAAFVTIFTLGVPLYVSVPLVILFCALVGMLIEKVAYKPLRGASKLTVLITAIGVSYFLQSLVLLLFGSKQQAFSSIVPFQGIKLNDVLTLSGESITTMVVTTVMMVGLTLFVRYSKMGKAMRALSEDAGAAVLMGIPVNRTISITFGIGSALAGVAGLLYASTYGFIGPYMGSMPGIKAFTAAVFGGIGSIPGAILGGLLLGVLEALTKAYISAELSDGIVFAVLIVILLVRPTGLLGRPVSEKV